MDRNTIADAVERWEPDMKPRRSQGRPLHATDFSGGLRETSPTLRDRVASFLWPDDRESQQRAISILGGNIPPNSADRSGEVIARSLNPLNAVFTPYNAGRAGAEGRYGEAVAEGLSSIPGIGKVAGTALGVGGKTLLGALGKAIFIGPSARLLPIERNALRHARELAGKGEAPEKILRQTGWFQGADGKWRMEISDENAKFLGYPEESSGWSGSKLPDVLEHEELYQRYPEMGNVEVERLRTDPATAGGTAPLKSRNEPAKMFMNPDTDYAAYPDMQGEELGTALHEGQHIVQIIEGQGAGGNVETRFTPGHQGYGLYQDALKELSVHPEYLKAKALDPDYADVLLEENAQRIAAMRYYSRLAGEVESRVPSARQKLTQQERRARPPWRDEQFPRSEQFVNLEDQQAMKRPLPVNKYDEPELPFGRLPREWQLGTSTDYGEHFKGVPKEQMEAAVHDHIQRLQRLLDRDPDPMKRQEIMRKIAQLEALAGRK